MLLNDSKKGPPHVQYRRPYGCAVLAMSDVFHTITDLKEEKDFVLKVYTWVIFVLAADTAAQHENSSYSPNCEI